MIGIGAVRWIEEVKEHCGILGEQHVDLALLWIARPMEFPTSALEVKFYYGRSQ